MSNQLDEYTRSTADWRKTIKSNQRRTYIVIGLFFLIYLAIGLLVDTYIASGRYPDVPLSTLFKALITFKLFPLASIIMLGVAAISLFISYSMYDKLMLMGTDYYEITPTTARTIEEQQLYNVVEEMKISAGIRYMPKVFVINADYMNAFASGYSEKSAMVAITRGLMEKLNRDELTAVMAHELSHIRHMDIKLTLTATLLANLTLMVLDIFFYNALFSSRRDNGKRNSLAFIIILLRYLLPIINVILLLYLSRRRELMADAGSVELMRTNQPLAQALIKIQNDYAEHQDRYNAELSQTPHENVRRESYLYDPLQAGIGTASISDLFSSHPSLETRLEALGFKKRRS